MLRAAVVRGCASARPRFGAVPTPSSMVSGCSDSDTAALDCLANGSACRSRPSFARGGGAHPPRFLRYCNHCKTRPGTASPRGDRRVPFRDPVLCDGGGGPGLPLLCSRCTAPGQAIYFTTARCGWAQWVARHSHLVLCCSVRPRLGGNL